MLNSLFMLGSSYNKNRKFSLIFMCSWIAYMLVKSNLSLGSLFPLINALAFIAICICINLVKNRTANTILSISSILIWSVAIDVICYMFYPSMCFGKNIFAYILQGIVFNYKYIFTNFIAVICINGIVAISDKISESNKNLEF